MPNMNNGPWVRGVIARYNQLCNEREEPVEEERLLSNEDWAHYVAAKIAFVEENGFRAGLVFAQSRQVGFDFFDLMRIGFVIGVVFAHDAAIPGTNLDEAKKRIAEAEAEARKGGL